MAGWRFGPVRRFEHEYQEQSKDAALRRQHDEEDFRARELAGVLQREQPGLQFGDAYNQARSLQAEGFRQPATTAKFQRSVTEGAQPFARTFGGTSILTDIAASGAGGEEAQNRAIAARAGRPMLPSVITTGQRRDIAGGEADIATSGNVRGMAEAFKPYIPRVVGTGAEQTITGAEAQTDVNKNVGIGARAVRPLIPKVLTTGQEADIYGNTARGQQAKNLGIYATTAEPLMPKVATAETWRDIEAAKAGTQTSLTEQQRQLGLGVNAKNVAIAQGDVALAQARVDAARARGELPNAEDVAKVTGALQLQTGTTALDVSKAMGPGQVEAAHVTGRYLPDVTRAEQELALKAPKVAVEKLKADLETIPLDAAAKTALLNLQAKHPYIGIMVRSMSDGVAKGTMDPDIAAKMLQSMSSIFSGQAEGAPAKPTIAIED